MSQEVAAQRAQQVDVIRVAPADWRRFRSIRLRALTENPAEYYGELDVEMAHGEEFWRERAETTGTFIATAHGFDAGLITVIDDEAGLIVTSLWTDPTCRGIGVMRALLAAAVDYTRNRGFTELLLGVYTHNTPAIATFERYGFVRHGDVLTGGDCGSEEPSAGLKEEWYRYRLELS